MVPVSPDPGSVPVYGANEGVCFDSHLAWPASPIFLATVIFTVHTAPPLVSYLFGSWCSYTPRKRGWKEFIMVSQYFSSLAMSKIFREDEAGDPRESVPGRWSRMLKGKVRNARDEPALVLPPRPVLCPLGNMFSPDTWEPQGAVIGVRNGIMGLKSPK